MRPLNKLHYYRSQLHQFSGFSHIDTSCCAGWCWFSKKSPFQGLMDLGLGLLLLASLQFHQNIKFCKILHNLLVQVASNKALSYNWENLKRVLKSLRTNLQQPTCGMNDLKELTGKGKQGVRSILDWFHSMACNIFDHRNLTPTRLMSSCIIPS